ncbi:SAVED domain-containing protein [Frigoribacterium sp. CFBP9039]|uniref:SAVED domain-containing protein n=1 Tax=Frigoribacterium sp. CFBP9029 TaxID=3096541 RepID=UPI002A6A7D00|nr:SAVED domain-containing protein [Frigoribacterium sp. CFBP9039]MDY0947067.1 SAVED domain-containing protein [Frigoribacterium sp. CFBP9039]
MTHASSIIDVSANADETIASQTAKRLPLETGGILLGYHDADKVVVTHAIVVESDVATRDRYVRDDVRANKLLAEFLSDRAEDDPIGYVGEWHSHPTPSGPSTIDRNAMRAAAKAAGRPVALLVFTPGHAGAYLGLIARRQRLGRAVTRDADVTLPASRFSSLGPLPDGAVRGKGPVFISYRQIDGTEPAESLENLLRAAGLVVWRDRVDLRPGTTTDRLEQALTEGLSAGVLVVTPDIVNSEIVRERELPRLLQLDEDPAFSLCIANKVAREDSESKCDYDAPDRLLRIAPARSLADKKQANLLDPSGELEIVRDLLMHRIQQRRPEIRAEGRDFSIRVQSRPAPFAVDDDDDDLHMRIKEATKGRLPSPDGLELLKRTLPLTGDAVFAAGAKRVRISGGGHLSIGLALGAALPATKIGDVVVLDVQDNAWESTPSSNDPGVTELDVKALPTEVIEASNATKRVAVFVTLTADPDLSSFQRLIRESAKVYAAAEIISVANKNRIDPREAGRLGQAIAQQIKRLAADHGRAEVHLAFHGPFPMSVLIGRYLNTLRILAYEWDGDTTNGTRYRPAVAIEPGVTGGPITEVLL